ncbi:MAG: hypothetical protein GX446_02980 [Chthonomonadales bacterium]|nr:hypothetical protein [Chthonomonadales bacterium]
MLAFVITMASLMTMEMPVTPETDARALFRSPDSRCRMLKIIHGWPQQPDATSGLLDSVAKQGYGGVVTNVNFDGGYTEAETNWTRFLHATSELRRRGMSAWLYDEMGYPSGRAGTLVLKDHPELEVRGLMTLSRDVAAGPVEIEAPEGDLLLAEAYPVVRGAIVLDRRVPLRSEGRKITWTAPRGAWRVVVMSVGKLFDGTQVACSGYPERTPYVGLMEQGLTPRFMEFTHDRYTRRMGKDLAKTFAATFTDEPSTMAIYFNAMPWGVLPWCSDFATEFRKRRGYELKPALAALAVEAGDRGRKARADYFRTVTELMTERWWEPLRRWSAANGVPSGGHLLLEENIIHHVPLYGNAFEAFRHMDSTGIDCLSSDPTVPRYASMAGMGADVPWNAARLASSVAELDGKPQVMCEVSEHIQNAGNTAKNLTEAHYRGTWGRLILGGISVLTSYHSFPGWTDERIKAANDWIGRCMAAVSGGKREAQVAVVYPTETVWARFTPSNLWVEQISPECRRVEETIRALSEALYRSRREFDYVDGRVLAEGRVVAATLVYKERRWSAVVLPECDTLPEAAWRNLAALKKAGGTVLVIGAEPRNCLDHFPCRVAASAARTLGTGMADAGSVPGKLDEVLKPDITVAADAPIRMTRRRIGNEEVWFLLNDSMRPWSGRIVVPAAGPVEVWDPRDGSIRTEASDAVALEFGPYDVLIVRRGAS